MTSQVNHEQFLKDAEDGKIDESRADEYLCHTLSTDQLAFLIRQRLSIPMIMNGRYTAEQEDAVHQWQRSVNKILGGKFWVNV
jgi:hypothetical protein